MAGQQYEYDESGSTFQYFLISFLALILVPSSFYFWPSEINIDEAKNRKTCYCEACQEKEARLRKPNKRKQNKKILQRILLLVGWAFLVFLAYRATESDNESVKFDPYDILEVESGSTVSEIKKAYRKLSLTLHPDKPTGDVDKFMELNKAYRVLTDETARLNYELYGNPDGPGAMYFGIALPSWMVDKDNSFLILAVYAIVFMIGLPVIVGIWWSRSIKFSNDQVLVSTSRLYGQFFYKTPHMVFKRALMILAASFEFEKGHNPEIQNRSTDYIELPKLVKSFPTFGLKNKEIPLCYPYSIKTRALLYAHLSRILLNKETLDNDRLYVIGMCPGLINEMVTCLAQLIQYVHAGYINRQPSLGTIEAVMKLSPHIVQAISEGRSAMLQLPHITKESLRSLIYRKRTVKTIQQYVAIPADERRSLLRNCTDDQYADIMNVCASFPLVSMEITPEVLDDENEGIFTAGCRVTVTVYLERESLEKLFHENVNQNQFDDHEPVLQNKLKENKKKDETTGWKKPKGKASKKNLKKKKVVPSTKENEDKDSSSNTVQIVNKDEDSVQNESETNSYSELSDEGNDDEDIKSSLKSVDEDLEWEKIQKGLTKREKILESKSRISHPVHCPFYKGEKQEFWWLYISCKKTSTLHSVPYYITNFEDKDEVELKFSAPFKPGLYTFQVCLRSDSYLGFDITQDFKLDIKKADDISTEHPQWEESEEDDESYDEIDDSEYTTDDPDDN